MNILLFGADGQLGFELKRTLSFFSEVIPLTRNVVDLSHLDAVCKSILETNPHCIVNAASYNDVDGAESQQDLAMKINAEATGVMGEIAKQKKIPLLHFSTDFVFDGLKLNGKYSETDAPNPLNTYAKSKLAGEKVLTELDAPALIFRTAWVYSLRRKSFVSTILRLAREREELEVVSDQYGNPTFCQDLAFAISYILYSNRSQFFSMGEEHRGIYHLSGSGSVSRFNFAKAILEMDPKRSEHQVKSLVPISSKKFPSPAIRPQRTDLDCQKVKSVFGIELPNWKEGLLAAFT